MALKESPLYGEIAAYSYMVERGKPAAVIAIPNRHVKEAETLIQKKFLLKTYVEDLGEGWKSIWIFKHQHILEIIKCLPPVPKTTFDHWVLGKLFGYDETSIQQFVKGR